MISTAATETLVLTSADFKDGNKIKEKQAYKSGNVPPQLSWKGAPKQTKSFALIVDDPDAPKKTWVHWVAYNIPATASSLSELGRAATSTNGIKQGVNDFGEIGYDGPYPPAGEKHRYYFKLYALDTALSLPAKTTKAKLEAAMKGHVLAEASLMGTYSRS